VILPNLTEQRQDRTRGIKRGPKAANQFQMHGNSGTEAAGGKGVRRKGSRVTLLLNRRRAALGNIRRKFHLKQERTSEPLGPLLRIAREHTNTGGGKARKLIAKGGVGHRAG